MQKMEDTKQTKECKKWKILQNWRILLMKNTENNALKYTSDHSLSESDSYVRLSPIWLFIKNVMWSHFFIAKS